MVQHASSKKPSKQRKMLFASPLHRRGRVMGVHLSRSLREKHGPRSLNVRRGDTVRIMRGDARGLEGKISKVNRKKYRVYVEGITRTKQSGDTVLIPIHYSNLELVKLDLGDPRRKAKLKRISGASGESS